MLIWTFAVEVTSYVYYSYPLTEQIEDIITFGLEFYNLLPENFTTWGKAVSRTKFSTYM